MEKFANAAFYILTFLAFASSLVILLSKEAKFYTCSAVVAFISVGGLYILLKSPAMFVIQIVFFALGLGALLVYTGYEFKPEKKSGLNLNFKTYVMPVVLTVFILLLMPFLAHQVQMQKFNTVHLDEILTAIQTGLNLNLILISTVVIAALSGFYTIAFWRKK